MMPPGAIDPTETAVLLAVLDGERTYQPLMDRTGLSRSGLWHALHRLRSKGLVSWTDGRKGTLVAQVQAVGVPKGM